MMHSEVSGLAQEISSDIIRGSDEDKTLVRTEIEQLHHDASRERNPDVAYITLLYRKYSAMVTANSQERGGPLSSFGWLERVLSDGTNSLRLRGVTAVLALIAFAVMASAPYIENKEFNPNHFFHRGCDFKGKFYGRFNFRSYQLVIAVGVIVFLINGAYVLHHCLPQDPQGRKYMPGLHELFGMVTGNASWAQNAAHSCRVFCEEHGSFMLMILDTVGFMLAVGSFIAASVAYQAIVSTQVFVQPYDHTQQDVNVEEYYTLSSCYITYAKKTPACLDKGLNPTPKIVASLVMLFFCILCLALCLMVSWKEFGLKDAQQLFTRLTSQQGPFTTDSEHAQRASFMIVEKGEEEVRGAGRVMTTAGAAVPGVGGAKHGATVDEGVEGDYVDL